MLIQHSQKNGKGSFFIEQDGNVLAEMVYTMPSPVRMIIEHTDVGEALRGKNVGYELVHAAVEYARTHKIRIIPLCPFAAAVFRKKAEYADVLHVQ